MTTGMLACVKENKYYTVTPLRKTTVFITNKPKDTTAILANKKVRKLLSIPHGI